MEKHNFPRPASEYEADSYSGSSFYLYQKDWYHWEAGSDLRLKDFESQLPNGRANEGGSALSMTLHKRQPKQIWLRIIVCCSPIRVDSNSIRISSNTRNSFQQEVWRTSDVGTPMGTLGNYWGLLRPSACNPNQSDQLHNSKLVRAPGPHYIGA